ncbi:MAG: hypothetical protein ACXU9L_06495 [Thermodesulfobacteriota bacterium]
MKTFGVSAVTTALVSILFCPMAMSAPSMPSDLQIVQPDPSLPKELSAFFGKWEGTGRMQYFLIVEKIDNEKASVWAWEYLSPETLAPGWARYDVQVTKQGGKYKLQYSSRFGSCEVTLKGEGLNWSRSTYESVRLKRVQ